jgi:hypothetical protein
MDAEERINVHVGDRGSSRSGPVDRLADYGVELRHPRTVFRRALEHGNLLIAEATGPSLISPSATTRLSARVKTSQSGRMRRQREGRMWPFVFLAGFAAGTLVTLLTGVVVDRVFPDAPRPQPPSTD